MDAHEYTLQHRLQTPATEESPAGVCGKNGGHLYGAYIPLQEALSKETP